MKTLDTAPKEIVDKVTGSLASCTETEPSTEDNVESKEQTGPKLDKKVESFVYLIMLWSCLNKIILFLDGISSEFPMTLTIWVFGFR